MRLAVPNVLHPSLQFRYTIFSSRIPGATIYARSSQQPGFENNPIKVDYGNSYFKIKGKTSWDDISIRCYQFEGITIPDFWKYVQQHQIVKSAKDQYGLLYKHDLRVVVLNPLQIPIGSWKLVGAFFSGVKFGDMDWGTDDAVEIDLTIAYDYAEYSFPI